MTMERRGLEILRLLTAGISSVLAYLAVFQAPTKALWRLAIGATEWGHILAVVALVPLIPRARETRITQVARISGGLAALILLTPLLRAILVARHLPKQLGAAFGYAIPSPDLASSPRQAPLIAMDLFRGVQTPRIRYDSRTYITRGQQSLSLDIYGTSDATASTRVPCVVVIHGGSWRRGTSQDLPHLNHYLAAHGYCVASINYRFAPQHRFPAAREDVQAAFQYLKASAPELGIDPQRLVLLGRSSGAHLAMLVAYSTGDPSIRGVISFYGPPDLRYSYEHPSKYPAVFNTRRVLNDFLGCSLEQLPTIYDEASPINYVGPLTPPTLLIHGGRDEFVGIEEIRRLTTRLVQARVPHLLVRLPWATHGGDFNFSGPSGQITTYAIERFLVAVVQDASENDRPVLIRQTGVGVPSSTGHSARNC